MHSELTLLWLFPERGTRRSYAAEETGYWRSYREAANRAGLRFLLVSPQSVDFEMEDNGRSRVFLDSEELNPMKVIVGGDIYHFPHQSIDIWAQLSAYSCLRSAGFYVPLSRSFNIPFVDKGGSYLEIQKMGVKEKFARSMRISTGRDFSEKTLSARLTSWDYPIVAKPSSWAGGMGVCVCQTEQQLMNYLKLASGADTTVIIQSCIDLREIRDIRIFLIDGVPVLTTERRPAPGGIIANVGRGGSLSIIDCPDALLKRLKALSEALEGDYHCIDYLSDGNDFYLSEIEVFGSIGGVPEQDAIRVLTERFLCYKRNHSLHVGANARSFLPEAFNRSSQEFQL